MKQQDLLSLMEKYLEGTATDEERERIDQYFDQSQQTAGWDEEQLGSSTETEAAIRRRLVAAVRQQQSGTTFFFYRQWGSKVAAALVLLLGSTMGWWVFHNSKQNAVAKNNPAPLVQPVYANAATLTLDNGQVIILDSVADGVLVNNEHAIIRKKGESISVEAPPRHPSAPVVSRNYHSLQTPAGKQLRATLSDGSQVWLNATSALRFPTAFSGSHRQVHLQGEAYFEVAKNKAQPFRVLATTLQGDIAKGSLVEVLGTHFNVAAYGDEEAIKTTLLEGSVKVAAVERNQPLPTGAPVLQPGEQATVFTRTTIKPIAVTTVATNEVVAWKNNLFDFNNTDLQTIMRQLSRWYNVEVVYVNKVPHRQFSGKISRKVPLVTVLEILEQSNIHFKVRGRQILVKS